VLRQKICFATWNRRTWQAVNTASSVDRHRYGQINRSIIDTVILKIQNIFLTVIKKCIKVLNKVRVVQILRDAFGERGLKKVPHKLF